MRRLLLDTHTLLWWLGSSNRLGRTARSLIADPDSEVWVSVATVWEMAIKLALGRLELGEPLQAAIEREFAKGFRPLGVTMRHAVAVQFLPRIHADPFDRMLIVQARIEGLTLVTVDEMVRRYDVSSLLATE